MRISKAKVAVLGTIILVVFVTLNITLKEYNVFTFILGEPGEYRIGYSTRIVDTKEAQQKISPDYAKQNCLALESSGFVWNEKTSECKKSESTTTTDSQLQTNCIKSGGTWNFSTKQCVFGTKTTTQTTQTSTPTTTTQDPIASFIATITGTVDPTKEFVFTENARCAILTDTKVTAIEYKDVDGDGDLEESFKISAFTDRSAPYPSGVLTITSPLSINTGEATYDVLVYIQCLKKTNTKLFTNSASDMYLTVQAQNSKQELVTVASTKLTVGKVEMPDNALVLIGTIRTDANNIEKNLDNGVYDSVIHFFTHGKLILNFEGFDKPTELYQIDIPQTKQGVVNYHKVRVEKEIPTQLDCKPPLVLQNGKCVQVLGNPPPTSPEAGTEFGTPLECFDPSFTSQEFSNCLGQKKFIAFYIIGFILMIVVGLIFRPSRKVMVEQQPGVGY